MAIVDIAVSTDLRMPLVENMIVGDTVTYGRHKTVDVSPNLGVNSGALFVHLHIGGVIIN